MVVARGAKVEGIGEIGEGDQGLQIFRYKVSHENGMNSRENRVNDSVITLDGVKR